MRTRQFIRGQLRVIEGDNTLLLSRVEKQLEMVKYRIFDNQTLLQNVCCKCGTDNWLF